MICCITLWNVFRLLFGLACRDIGFVAMTLLISILMNTKGWRQIPTRHLANVRRVVGAGLVDLCWFANRTVAVVPLLGLLEGVISQARCQRTILLLI